MTKRLRVPTNGQRVHRNIVPTGVESWLQEKRVEYCPLRTYHHENTKVRWMLKKFVPAKA